MLSLVNSFGGISATELLQLFGVKASSSSPDSKSTTPSTSIGVAGSSAGGPANTIQAILKQAQNPTNAIQAILTQAQIAQTATSGRGSVSLAAATVAYAAETESSGEDAAVSEIAASLYAAQVTVSGPAVSAGAAISSPDSIPQLYKYWLGMNAASLTVVSGTGVDNVTIGTADEQVMAIRASDTLGTYQFNLSQLQQEQAQSQIPAWESNASSGPAPDGATDDASGYLQLSIAVYGGGGPGEDAEDAYVQAQAQQLVAAFENNVPSSASATGFSYAGVYGFSGYSITGIEVSGSNVFGYGMSPITQDSDVYNPGFQSLISESTAMSGGYNSSYFNLDFAVRLPPQT